MNIKCLFGMHDWNIISPWKSRVCNKCGKFQMYVLVNWGMDKAWVTFSNEPWIK